MLTKQPAMKKTNKHVFRIEKKITKNDHLFFCGRSLSRKKIKILQILKNSLS